jgi:hypothetical protein
MSHSEFLREQIQQQVAKGVGLLNELMPGWASKIDLDRFDFKHHANCILGQLYGGYTTGLFTIFGVKNTDPWTYGFNVDCNASDVEMGIQRSILHPEWKRVVQELRGA